MNVTSPIKKKSPKSVKTIREELIDKCAANSSHDKEIPKGTIPLDTAIDEIWNQLEKKFGYDIRTEKR